jgi:ribosomal-protein-alanine N-acetyltransferase
VEKHRRKGVGSALVKACHVEMLLKGASESYLEVRISNGEAIALYEGLGYRTTGQLESYYKDGEAAFLMALQIGK